MASGADSEQKSQRTIHLNRGELLKCCSAGEKEKIDEVIRQLRAVNISLEAPHLQEFFVQCLWMAQKGV